MEVCRKDHGVIQIYGNVKGSYSILYHIFISVGSPKQASVTYVELCYIEGITIMEYVIYFCRYR